MSSQLKFLERETIEDVVIRSVTTRRAFQVVQKAVNTGWETLRNANRGKTVKFVQTRKVGVAIVATIITTKVIIVDDFQHLAQSLQILRADVAIPKKYIKSLINYKN